MKVQRRLTKMAEVLGGYSYVGRLRIVILTTVDKILAG